MGRRGSLQSVALLDIAAQLRALLDRRARERPLGAPLDAAKAHLLLLSVTERFAGLADNAQAFMASLRRTVDLADGDLDAFLAYKERLIVYLQRFVADLANQGAEIAGLTLEPTRPAMSPVAGDRRTPRRGRRGTGLTDADDETNQEYIDALRRWHERWNGLRSWFVSVDSRRQSQAKLLRSAAISAITQLVDAARTINERRAGRSDRSADFRTLARWFAGAHRTTAPAHRLWQAAFGLGSARHLSISAETLEVWRATACRRRTPPGVR